MVRHLAMKRFFKPLMNVYQTVKHSSSFVYEENRALNKSPSVLSQTSYKQLRFPRIGRIFYHLLKLLRFTFATGTTKMLNLEQISIHKSRRLHGKSGNVEPKMKTLVVKAFEGDNFIGSQLTQLPLTKNVIFSAIWQTMEILSELSERPA